ncbi:DUF294 nucleotidyltransferase-like domain-containing protein [Jeotgalibacillus sp. R-1-5s-1]|uniref:DUF294 nucleotidyltransferase-like domain-containing protein n=1 Tax=Jeotgalibacillus sp. R-1-5s-1 TaxID=2555897 RepID=UPI00106B7870|nr:DUF294 nucleotidyltransferase-like domain-containing protein [Jeotgalibacillus sp. R-1-5s-1]TFD92830.1 CBS domain-containing protein [Jeotgalibacillus sp. R-1-5s-1]
MTETTYRRPDNRESIRSFIRKTPLFQNRSEKAFHELYASCQERQYDQGVLIADTKKKREGILLITSGLAEVYAAGFRNEREVLELAGPGEIVGLASISSMLAPSDEEINTVEIMALETTMGLFIPYSVLKVLWGEPEVQAYFLEKAIFRLRDVYQSLTEQLQQAGWMEQQKQVFQRVQDMMSSPLLTVSKDSTIKEAISFMADHHLSAAVYLDQQQPYLVSMREIMGAIAENRQLSEPLQSISREAVIIHRNAYYYDALAAFQREGELRHIVVVNQNSQPVGMLTLSDVLKQKHRSIQALMKEINRLDEATLSSTSADLRTMAAQLIEERETIRMLSATVTPLFDQLTRKIISETLLELGEPPCKFAFYQMGSAGRGEQFNMTDQDHFLVFERNGLIEEKYFKDFGEKIVQLLEAAGFKRCDGNMMASNEFWRGSISDWEQKIRRWALRSTPQNILYAYNFFAMRWLAGDAEIHHAFLEGLQKEMDHSGVLLRQMAEEIKRMPIPSLDHRIRSLILREGKVIDLKKQVLFPFHHALQIYSVRAGVLEGSTADRIGKLTEMGKITEDEELKESLDFILLLNLLKKHHEGTSVIIPDQITSREKALLTRSLHVLRQFQQAAVREMGV